MHRPLPLKTSFLSVPFLLPSVLIIYQAIIYQGKNMDLICLIGISVDDDLIKQTNIDQR